MAVLYQRFATAAAAQQAIQALMEIGIPPNDVALFTGAALHEDEHERVGSFGDVDSGTHAPEHTGRFDDVAPHHPSTDEARVGSFDDETGHIGDARRERVGSFADVDHDAETTFGDADPHTQHPSHQAILARLRAAGLSDADAQAHLEALHAGHALVLVDAPPHMTDRVQTLLQRT